MARGLDAIGRRQGRATERHEGTRGIIAVLLVVTAMAAMAEVVAGRAVATVDRPRATDWEVSARIADEALARGDAPAARRAYLNTLFRARGERALAGVVHAAEGFEALGDREVVDQALRIAATLGPDGADETLLPRLRGLKERSARK